MASKYYAVLKGRTRGIYTNWADCEKQVKGFKGAVYKSYKTREEADDALLTEDIADLFDQQKTPYKTTSGRTNRPTGHYICCDAAYSHSTKVMEYRVVEVKDKLQTEVHRSPAYKGGSANVGEFMAILDSLVYMHRHNLTDLPLYSDSYNAQKWVSQGFANSGVTMEAKLEKAYWERFDALKEGKYKPLIDAVDIRDWATKYWGEIPADFGRK